MAHILRISIDQNWTLNEYAETLRTIQQLYDLHVFCSWSERQFPFSGKRWRHFEKMMHMFDMHPREAEQFFSLMSSRNLWLDSEDPLEAISRTLNEWRDHDIPSQPDPPATIHRLEFSSPGITDLAGASGIIGHLKDFLLRIAEMYMNRGHQAAVTKQLELENDQAEIQLQAAKLDLISKFIEVARKAGFKKKQIRQLLQSVDGRVEQLGELVSKGKITGIATREESNSPNSPKGD